MESLVVEPLSCHSVRLGTYKVFPPEGEESVTVYMTPESIKFYAPSARGCFQLHEIVIKHDDIISMVFHFEENAAVFIHPTAAFGDKTRQLLNIDRACNFVFNPEHEKFRFIFITFTINVLKKDHVDFIRQFYLPRNSCDFLNAKEYKELSLITAPRLTVNFVRTTATNDHPSVVWEEGTEAGVSTSRNAVGEIPILSYKSKCSEGLIHVSNIDVMYLSQGRWLNDNLVNFYLEYIYSEFLTDKDRERTHLFNSYFFSSLNKTVNGIPASKRTKLERHDFVKSWTKQIDIFSKDYIVIPVYRCNHWFLVIVCFPWNINQNESEMNSENIVQKNDENETIKKQMVCEEGGSQFSATTIESSAGDYKSNGSQKKEMPCICVFDSLYSEMRHRRTSEVIRDYLEIEYMREKKGQKSFLPMKIFSMSVPQQPNSCDCGLYLLENFQCFFQKPIENFGDPMPDLKDWYHQACIFKKRQDILRIIFDLTQE